MLRVVGNCLLDRPNWLWIWGQKVKGEWSIFWRHLKNEDIVWSVGHFSYEIVTQVSLRSRWPLLILKVTRPKVKGRIMSAQYLKNPLFVTLLYLPWNGWVAFFFNLPYWGHINVSTTICFLLHCYEKSCVYWMKTLKSSCLMLYLHLLWYLNV